ncbi:MAG: hypothetical protein ABIS26_00930 [Candidatus Paceibacterota bacterium]
MCSIIFRNPKNSKILLFGTLLSGALVLIFQTVHLFLPKVLSLGVLADKTGNVLGSWNSLGLFAGFSLLMSLIIVEFFLTTKREKAILSGLIILSLIIAAVVNFSLVWTLVGAFSVIIFIYKASLISKNKKVDSGADMESRMANFPVFSFAIIIVSLLFFISGNLLGGFITNKLHIQNSEVSPSLSSTMQVTKSVLKTNPIVGVGPNRFGTAFAMHKPLAINNSQFWDTFFNSGSGLLPTMVSTTGYLGILAWLVFFALFLYSGIKSIFSRTEKEINWERMAFFVLSLYLFVSAFFYSTGPVIFLLALAFAGVFVGLSSSHQIKGEVTLMFLNDHRKSFFSMLFLVLLIILSVAVSFKYIERLISVSYFGKTVNASTVPLAESNISKALTLYQNDLYLRTYAQVYLVKLNSQVQTGSTPTDADKASIQATLDQAVNGARLAIAYDPRNYLNFQTLGSVYQTAATLGVKDGYTKAVEQYKIASTLNPNNPGLRLAMATASFADGKIQDAKDYINQALELKPDYIEALLVFSQIAKSEGDTTSALFYAKRAQALSPSNSDLNKYIDSLNKAPASTTPTPSESKTVSPAAKN